jgi:hypothetical protein
MVKKVVEALVRRTVFEVNVNSELAGARYSSEIGRLPAGTTVDQNRR